MSYLLDSLLDPVRLADVIRNDAAAGFPPAPPVEMDEEFFRRADLAMLADKSAEAQRRRDHRALEAQQRRLGAVI